MGMPPRNAKLYTLMTRPRISLVVMSCTKELTVANTPMSEAPDRNSRTQLKVKERDNENPVILRPRHTSIVRDARPLWLMFPSHAMARAPAIEPQPDAE